MRFLPFLIGLVVATSLVSGRPAAPPTSMSTGSTHEKARATPVAARLDAYAGRLEALKKDALGSGRVSYAQVVAAAYPEGVLTPDVIARKRERYRAEVPVPFTDYSRMDVSVPVDQKTYIAGKTPGSRLWGQYHFGRHQMYVDYTAHANVIIHETGHVLQQKQLVDHRRHGISVVDHAEAEYVEEAAKQGVISASRSARIRYLIRQDEMDVRLQDLNRFHANVVAGRPILTHRDALRALQAIGVRPTADEIRAACELAGIRNVELRTGQHMIVDSRIDMLFDDAAELRELCYWSKRAGGELWPDVLARILERAPYHF